MYDPKRNDSAAAFQRMKSDLDKFYSLQENDVIVKRDEVFQLQV